VLGLDVRLDLLQCDQVSVVMASSGRSPAHKLTVGLEAGEDARVGTEAVHLCSGGERTGVDIFERLESAQVTCHLRCGPADRRLTFSEP
jgi:hypothetical protein